MVRPLDPGLEVGDLGVQDRGEVLVLAQACRDGPDMSVAHVRKVVETTHAVCLECCIHIDHIEHPSRHFELVPPVHGRDPHVLWTRVLIEAHRDEAGDLVG